jgi:hypothetical protein
MAESIIIHFLENDPVRIINRIEGRFGAGSHQTWSFPKSDSLLLISPYDDFESEYEAAESDEVKAKLGGAPTFSFDFEIRRSRSDDACEVLERFVREDLQGLNFVVNDMSRFLSHLDLENTHDFLDCYRYKMQSGQADAPHVGSLDDARIAGTD